eukprot:3631895-Rhodomonas_salina.3
MQRQYRSAACFVVPRNSTVCCRLVQKRQYLNSTRYLVAPSASSQLTPEMCSSTLRRDQSDLGDVLTLSWSFYPETCTPYLARHQTRAALSLRRAHLISLDAGHAQVLGSSEQGSAWHDPKCIRLLGVGWSRLSGHTVTSHTNMVTSSSYLAVTVALHVEVPREDQNVVDGGSSQKVNFRALYCELEGTCGIAPEVVLRQDRREREERRERGRKEESARGGGRGREEREREEEREGG